MHFDTLATTNRFGVSKIDDLPPRILGQSGIELCEMIYNGDSEDRDMTSAMAEEIFTIVS